MCMYRILLSKRPWALVIDGPKTGLGAYTGKPFVCITHTYMYVSHRIIKRGCGHLHGDGHLLKRIRYVCLSHSRWGCTTGRWSSTSTSMDRESTCLGMALLSGIPKNVGRSVSTHGRLWVCSQTPDRWLSTVEPVYSGHCARQHPLYLRSLLLVPITPP